MVTGGGSGGHITPILAVAHELKQQRPDVEIIYIGQRGDALADVPAADPNVDQVYTVWAGKLRRYAGEGWGQLLDVRTQMLNVRDICRTLYGVGQSYWLIRKLQPDVVFTRGGFVSVPVALGGRLNGVPYMTHDSDSVPSLANRLIARGAAAHAVALPKELYPYPAAKTVTVGVPVSDQYQPITDALRQQYRQELGLQCEQLVFLTGGGNGAGALNEALVANARYLLGTYPKLTIVHLAGRALEAQTNEAYDSLQLGSARSRVQVHGFVTDMYRYSGAADVVIARGGATSLAEFAQQQLACIIVPAPHLVGGHQVKNTDAFADRGAVVAMSEAQIEQPERLGRAIGELLTDSAARQALATRLATYARPQAAHDLAALILKLASGDVRAERA